MRITQKRLAIIIAYFLIYVVWGSTYYFIGVIVKDLPPFLVGAFRFTSAGLLLLAFCYFRRERIFKPKLIGHSAVSGIILLFVDMAVIMLAQRYVNSSVVAIVASSTAIWIMCFDVPMWKKNFRNVATITGILLGFVGVGILYFQQLNTQTAEVHREYGMLLLIGGCISWALGTLYAKYRSCYAEQDNGFAGAAWQMFFASMMFWICSIANGEVEETDFGKVSCKSWLSLVYLITFGSILAYSAYVWLLKVRPATEVATHAYINPIVAVIIGVGLGNEAITLLHLTGLVVILASVMLVNRKYR